MVVVEAVSAVVFAVGAGELPVVDASLGAVVGEVVVSVAWATVLPVIEAAVADVELEMLLPPQPTMTRPRRQRISTTTRSPGVQKRLRSIRTVLPSLPLTTPLGPGSRLQYLYAYI